jgi:ankyrin repeat protein
MNKSSPKGKRRSSLGPIHQAVMIGDLAGVREGIRNGDDINELDRDGRSPLFISVKDGRLDISSDLIDAGANVNAHDNNLETPLHFAAREHQMASANLLLQHGAHVDAQDSHGNTALSQAVFDSKGRGEMIALLLTHSADKHLKNKHGVSPDELAHSIANYEVSKFLT